MPFFFNLNVSFFYYSLTLLFTLYPSRARSPSKRIIGDLLIISN